MLNTKKYDKYVHKYLEIFNHTNNAAKLLNYVNSIDDDNIKNQLIQINNITTIKNASLFETYDTIFNASLDTVNCDISFNKTNEKIKLINKAKAIRFKQYFTMYDDEYLFNTYQCYLKSSIYFFICNDSFVNVIRNNDNNFNNILIETKQYLNENYNNKYILSIPGIKVYPSIVINDILKLEKDEFSRCCFYKTKNECGFIYDLTKSLKYINNNPIVDAVYKLFTQYDRNDVINETKNKDYFNNKLNYYFKNITNNTVINITSLFTETFTLLPNDLLLHCPLYDTHDLYMINTVHSIMSSSKINVYYSKLKKAINYANKFFNIKVHYPYNFILQDVKYKLHSFIICNTTETIDSHFVYYKKFDDSICRYDGIKQRYFSFNKNDKYYDELKIITKDGITDNMLSRVVFVCYRKE